MAPTKDRSSRTVDLSFDDTSIRAALTALAAKDTKGRVFGSDSHSYKLQPPIDESAINAFEEQHSVTLPEDYRKFITTIGNGGAGPAYGLFRFGEHDDGYGFRPWEGGYLTGTFANPFPHEAAWNHTADFWAKQPEFTKDISQSEQDRLYDEWNTLLEAEYWNGAIVDGAIPICHTGCAYRQWLVINGPQRGFIWNDDRAGCGGLSPVIDADGHQCTFTNWYLGWLTEALKQLKIKLK